MLKIFHFKRIVYPAVLIFFIYATVEYFRSKISNEAYNKRLQIWDVADKINYVNISLPYKVGEQACRHPMLDVHAHEIMKLMHPPTPIVCSETEDWVTIEGNVAKITEKAKKLHGNVLCAFTDIIRETDTMNKNSPRVFSRSEYTLNKSDFIRVSCNGSDGERWRGILAGIRRDPEAAGRSSWDKVKADGLPVNVIIWGFDSLSRNMFIRTLPKTYQYMKDELGVVALEGYNIVGDGTPQALIPILTGQTELELPETRKRMGSKAKFVNVYPFVWNDFQENGYVTAFHEDSPNIGTFTYRLRGFNKQPTDHYMRTFFVAAHPEFGGEKKFCMGSIPRHKIMMNQVKNLYHTYPDKPKFLFSFHCELSHDSINQVTSADEDLLELFQWMKTEGHLNNTLLVVMSDHGHRFMQIRDTQQGKQEERLPNFLFVFPPWFKQRYPEPYQNFMSNSKRLATPFDIYPTLKSILNFPPAHGNNFGTGSVKNRSISLFSEVPKERTCENAGIEPHWCACLSWHELRPGEDLIAQKAAIALIDAINRETQPTRKICHNLILNRLSWAGRFQPHKGLLQFQKNADLDGFVPDLSAHTDVTQLLYQVKVQAKPGGGVFEASLRYDTRDQSFAIKVDDISRINKYGSAAHCVENTLEHLRKYCYCKEPPPTTQPVSSSTLNTIRSR
ncbi:uncharacterized protein LOC132202977 [Neocloeon triangulifer]|uniref:uncharacterized protein LOC132202977 n=1 Tax=Neocloeon triangulifer TaxID=2078957 RepID=UPI00286ED47D|nr:uncharacterized protein LOC132202977 [Neocloeon triangulifer]XP_059486351.1 uncharacterized protein LOC132202977 [Neocloeon triangulifer]